VLTERARQSTRPNGVKWGLDSYFKDVGGDWYLDSLNGGQGENLPTGIVTFKSSLDVLPLCKMQMPGTTVDPAHSQVEGLWQCRMYLTNQEDAGGTIQDGSLTKEGGRASDWTIPAFEAASNGDPPASTPSLQKKGFCDFTYEKAGDADDEVDGLAEGWAVMPFQNLPKSSQKGRANGVTTLGFRLVQARCRVHRSGLPNKAKRRETSAASQRYAKNGGYNAVDDDGHVCSDLKGKNLRRFTAQSDLNAVQAGHVLASSLGGLGGVLANIFPQDPEENGSNGAWHHFEHGVLKCLENKIVEDGDDAILHLAFDFIYHKLKDVVEGGEGSRAVKGLYKPIRIAYTLAWPAGITNALRLASERFAGDEFCTPLWKLFKKDKDHRKKEERELIHAMLGSCVPTARGPLSKGGSPPVGWEERTAAPPDVWPLLVKEVMSMSFLDFERFKGSGGSPDAHNQAFEAWLKEAYTSQNGKDKKVVKTENPCPLLFAVREEVNVNEVDEASSSTKSLKFVGAANSMKNEKPNVVTKSNVVGRLARTVYINNPCSCKASRTDRNKKSSYNSFFFQTLFAPFVRVYALPELPWYPTSADHVDPTKLPAVQDQLNEMFDNMFIFHYAGTKASKRVVKRLTFRDISLAVEDKTVAWTTASLPEEQDDGSTLMRSFPRVIKQTQKRPDSGYWPAERSDAANSAAQWPSVHRYPQWVDIKMRSLVVDDDLGAMGYNTFDEWGSGESLPCIVANSYWWGALVKPAVDETESSGLLRSGLGWISRHVIADKVEYKSL